MAQKIVVLVAVILAIGVDGQFLDRLRGILQPGQLDNIVSILNGNQPVPTVPPTAVPAILPTSVPAVPPTGVVPTVAGKTPAISGANPPLEAATSVTPVGHQPLTNTAAVTPGVAGTTNAVSVTVPATSPTATLAPPTSAPVTSNVASTTQVATVAVTDRAPTSTAPSVSSTTPATPAEPPVVPTEPLVVPTEPSVVPTEPPATQQVVIMTTPVSTLNPTSMRTTTVPQRTTGRLMQITTPRQTTAANIQPTAAPQLIVQQSCPGVKVRSNDCSTFGRLRCPGTLLYDLTHCYCNFSHLVNLATCRSKPIVPAAASATPTAMP